MNYTGIYFLQYGDSAKITKIGKAVNLKKRLRDYITYSNEQQIRGYVLKVNLKINTLHQWENLFHLHFNKYYSHGEWYKIPVNFDYNKFFKKINVEYDYFLHRIRPLYTNKPERKPAYMSQKEWEQENDYFENFMIQKYFLEQLSDAN